jgi:hypothetical protein
MMKPDESAKPTLNGLRKIKRIDTFEVVTFFRSSGPRLLALKSPQGAPTYLTTEMCTVGPRLEIGLLMIWDLGDPSPEGTAESFQGGNVMSMEFLASPGFSLISGVRFRLENEHLVFTPGAMPLSICVKYGEIQRGQPEYPFDEYTVVCLPT